jgi:signal transduction histidine kinase
LAIFSSVLIYTIDSRLEENLNGKIIINKIEEHTIQNTEDAIEFLVFYIDGVFILIAMFLSYFLAGITLKPIRENLDSQEKFLADASHDLRTPISIITTESEVALQNDSLGEKGFKKIIESNLEEAKKMSKLVNDLLLISRGENKDTADKFVSVDLYNFIKKIVSKMKTQIQNKNLGFEMSEYKKIKAKICASDFERAILNILQNAINYTKVGKIKVDIADDVKKAYIKISDTGVGIDGHDLPFIFDRFYKAEHSRHDGSGSGLGLSIVKQITEQHGGNIEIDSQVGVGTTITIAIPKN